MKKRFDRLKNDPRFQHELKKLKPKRNIWGFLGIVLFFFVPEILNDFYSKEINSWIYNFALDAPNRWMSDSLIWLGKKAFDGKVSFLNIALGVIFLIWLFKKDSNERDNNK